LCIARGKDPVLGRVIAQSSYQLIGLLRGHLVDVLAQLVHALNLTQKAISHRRHPFYDFAFYVGIFLASYITFLPLILSTSARIFSVVSNTVLAAAAEHERHMIGERTRHALAAATDRGVNQP
jgi:hypothetical protein